MRRATRNARGGGEGGMGGTREPRQPRQIEYIVHHSVSSSLSFPLSLSYTHNLTHFNSKNSQTPPQPPPAPNQLLHLQQWLEPSRPQGSPPVVRLQGSLSLPRPPGRRECIRKRSGTLSANHVHPELTLVFLLLLLAHSAHQLPVVLRSPTGTGQVPSLSERSGSTR